MKLPAVLTTEDVVKIFLSNPWISGGIAVALSLFEIIYGDHYLTKYGMSLLLILIILDWLTGFSAAKKDQIDTSSYGIEGLRRTAVLLLLPAAANYVDEFFMTHGLASYFMIAALARHLAKSVTANSVRAEWTQWVPLVFIDKLIKWASDEIASKDARAKERYDSLRKKDDKGGEE